MNMSNPTSNKARLSAGSLCKYTHPVDAEEAALLFLVVEAALDGTPPRMRIRPLFWPWQIVPEECVSPEEVTALTSLNAAGALETL
jgi:hypothetical protein